MGTWNYRIATYNFSYKNTFPNNKEFQKVPDVRMFKIISVYYDEHSNINGYGEGGSTDSLDGFENVKDIEDTIKKIKKALKKPILDLDNFPNIYLG